MAKPLIDVEDGSRSGSAADMPTVEIPMSDRPTDDLRASHAGRLGAAEESSLPEAAAEIIETEGSAAHVSSSHERPTAVGAWSFLEHSEPQPIRLSDVPALIQDDAQFIWIALADYDPEDLRKIAELVCLDRVSIHLTLSAWQRPRLEVFKDQYFVSATIAEIDSGLYRIRASELDLCVGRNFLVSASKMPLPFTEHVLTRASRNPELVRLDSSYMLYIILDEVLEYYERLNEEIQGLIERMEQRALTDTSEAFLQDLLSLKRYTFGLAQLAEQHRHIFEGFLRPDFSFVSGNEVDVYFRDLETRLSRLVGSLNTAREAVNGAFEIYVSHVSHRTNQIIKVLTMVSVFLLPMTMVVSFFGTSFRHLDFLYSPGGFVGMVACMVLIGAGILFTFHRAKWL